VPATDGTPGTPDATLPFPTRFPLYKETIMPSPETSLSVLRPDLRESLEEFDLQADREGYIAHRVLPVIEVDKSSGQFGIIPVEQLLQERDTARSARSGYARGDWTFQKTTYATAEQGAEEPVDSKEAAMYRDFFDAHLVSAQRARHIVMMNRERRVAAAVFNATTFTSQTTSVTNEWDANHKTDATPIQDVETAVQAVWNRTGVWPNALIVNRKVFRNLRNLDEIKDRIASSGAGYPSRAADITAEQLAQVFDLQYILVAGGARNSATEGQALSISSIWSDEYAMVTRIAESNDFREVCLGRTFHWGEDGSEIGGLLEEYRDETIRSDVIRCRHEVDELLLYTEIGQLLDNITT